MVAFVAGDLVCTLCRRAVRHLSGGLDRAFRVAGMCASANLAGRMALGRAAAGRLDAASDPLSMEKVPAGFPGHFERAGKHLIRH